MGGGAGYNLDMPAILEPAKLRNYILIVSVRKGAQREFVKSLPVVGEL